MQMRGIGGQSDLCPEGGYIAIADRQTGHTPVQHCVFRELWALISRDLEHAFHAILSSHFADAGRLANGRMEPRLDRFGQAVSLHWPGV